MAVTVWAYNADNSTVNGNRRAELTYSQTKGSSSQNYSTINWTLTIAGTSGGNWYDTGPIEAWIGSNRVYYLSERKSWSYGQFPVAPGSVKDSFQLNHNKDGSVAAQTVTLKAAIFTGTVHTSSTTWNLESIARYFSSTPSLNLDEKTETSLKYSWSTSETCSQYTIYYKKSSDSSWTTVNKTSVNATSGTFTLSNLTANTLYHVYIKATRSDSGLTSDSTTQKPTTYQWPYIKSVGSNPLTIGNTQTIKIYNPKGRTITFKIDASDGTNLYTKSWNPGTGENIEYTITDLTASKFYAEIPTTTSGTANYYCYYSSTSYKVATVSATYQIAGTEKPIITTANFTFKDSNTNVTGITSQGNGGWLVQSLSTLQLSLTSAGTLTNNANGYIKSYDATFAGTKKTLTATASTTTGTFEAWGTFNNSGTHKITITATDSRGLVSDPITIDVTFVAYYAPTVTLSGSRQNNYGETVNLSMSYSYSTVNSKNSLTKKYRRTDSSTYTTTTSTANPIKLTLTASNENAYTYEAVVTDKFNKTASSTITIPRGLPIMFVDSAVLGVGVNTFPTISGLDVNGEIHGKNGINVGWITDYGSQTITVGGDANTYYPVIISNKSSTYDNPYLTFHISRGYSRTAPDTWYSSTHKGGLTLSFLWSGDGAWGGNYKTWKILAFDEQYCQMVAKMALLKRGMTIWLRGGGAYYRFHCDAGTRFSVTPYLDGFTDSDGVAYSSLTSISSSDRATITNAMVSRRIDLWPVGSIYMSTKDTSPASFIGGTWTRLKDKFLLGYGDTYTSAGGTGGASTVTLTTTQIPSHTHTIPALSGTAASAGSHYHKVTSRTTTYASGVQSAWRCLSFVDTSSDYGQNVYTGGRTSTSDAESAGAHTHSVTTTAKASESTGGGGSHENMPPYKIVYMWERTA